MLCFRSETVQDVFLWGGVGQVRPRILHVGKYLARADPTMPLWNYPMQISRLKWALHVPVDQCIAL